MPNLYVRRHSNNEVVHTVEVRHPYQSIRGMPAYQRVMAGMLQQMNTDEYFIDDSEIEDEPDETAVEDKIC